MNKITQNFQVSFNYDVFFTKNIFDKSNPLLINFFKINADIEDSSKYKKLLVIIDKGFLDFHAAVKDGIINYFKNSEYIRLINEIVTLDGGELTKNNSNNINKIFDLVSKYNIDRHSYILAIGGGAFLDMAGYAAAIAHRGINFIRLPTTVLAQSDAGIGVKNGINFEGKKNFLGTFSPAKAIFNDSNFLNTLSNRDWQCGSAEAIKIALIKDISFFEWLEKNALLLTNRDTVLMEQQILRCADLHLKHISTCGDPFERGSARPLDFGHWLAHNLESVTNFELRHGEAVAIGIAIDSTYSYFKNYITHNELKRILSTLKNLGFKLYHPILLTDKMNLHQALNEFREHLGGELTITLLNGLGKSIDVHELDISVIEKSIKDLIVN